MDEVLKRRLAGAAVLMLGAFAVASLLPEPSTGERDEADRVVTYDLRTGEPLGAEPVRPVPRPAPAPEARPEPPRSAAPAEPPPAAPLWKPAPVKVPHLRVAESLGESAAGWYIQIGSFENQSNAGGVRQKLAGAGLPALIQTVPAGKKVWYRVRVGPYGSEAGAEKALNTIRKQGYPLAKLVRPDSPSGN